MLFADDIVLVCKTKAELKRELSRWRRALEDRGFKISRTKTEYLQFNDNEDDEEMRMDDESIKRVAAFNTTVRNKSLRPLVVPALVTPAPSCSGPGHSGLARIRPKSLRP
ncbi:hypothetical protein Pmani_004890 [Petrolisthes manimaculis]|uniref:Reverse transcriptase domain-containing protein n=1 Tax=Petrolisthes manimaculis TaxID=1843537 RepID=A0AAE1UH59_9EUCA|nr:hypothetical protein Pmani_004890 [Petrolisthes manimaculis]